MNTSNNLFLFLIVLLATQSFTICLKTEIKFYLNNVPTLFRCKKNGPLFYFDHFPDDDILYEALKIENSLVCDLSLASIDRRAIVDVTRLDLLCEILHGKRHVNEFLHFLSKCSKDLCKKSIPSTATIITEYKTGHINIERINLIFHESHPSQLLIGKLTDDKYLRTNYSLKNGDIRTNQILFEYDDRNYLNYYPSQSETHLDHNMIYKAVAEFEATNSKGIRILLRKFDASSDNSSSINKPINVDLSKYSTWILLFMILLTCICACCYISKNKTKTKQMKISNRSSEQSQYSHETLDDIFNE
ncbi:unnamed protein product [Rotaria socialis]|uniref:Uncharacterized protein n=1 Tax=Rotaria socialis TaxID=392032 RepID=A0A820X8K8_9BILA|nr:unnamed protein product [Rotaria socialis]